VGVVENLSGYGTEQKRAKWTVAARWHHNQIGFDVVGVVCDQAPCLTLFQSQIGGNGRKILFDETVERDLMLLSEMAVLISALHAAASGVPNQAIGKSTT
jgi:hypothetical protein